MKNILCYTVLNSMLILSIMVSVDAFAQEDTWTKKADFGGGVRYAGVGFSIGNKAYIGTGSGVEGNNAAIKNDFWEYDPVSNTWSQKANFAGGVRFYATGISIGNKGYVGMGYGGYYTDRKNDFWEYDPVMNVWVQKADFGGPSRVYSTSFSIGSKGYVGVGNPNDGGAIKKDFWEYDPAINKWTQKADFAGAARYSATGLSIGNKGYIGLGKTQLIFLKDFWEYNPGSDSWAQKSDFGGDARYLASGFGLSNKGYVGLGSRVGINGGTLKDDFWEYDPIANTWIRKANYGGGIREDAVAFSIGKKGYFGIGIGGAGYNPSVSDFWEYTPAAVDINATNVYVPGTSNPWLAGMPDGTVAEYGDMAPANSPVLVPLKFVGGSWIEVSNVTGAVAHGEYPTVGPEGCLSQIECNFGSFIISHDVGAQYGKSNLTAPINSLIAVFLDDNIPSDPAPVALDFSSPTSRDYAVIHPLLQQIFFVGDGRTSTGIQQKIYVPKGGTRLFLGTMDGVQWFNNVGAFNATVKLFEYPVVENCGINNGKVQICHKGKTLCIASSAVAAHLAHGDQLGNCFISSPGKAKGKNGDASVLENEMVASFNVFNAPNPVKTTTRLQYELPDNGHVVIKIYNALGSIMATLVDSKHQAGIYSTDFSAGTLTNGVYYYQVLYTTDQHNLFIKTGKIVVAK